MHTIRAFVRFDEIGLCHRAVTHALPYIHVSSLRPLVPVSIARQFKSEADRPVGMGLGYMKKGRARMQESHSAQKARADEAQSTRHFHWMTLIANPQGFLSSLFT
jgi:hypothetical protein